MKTLEYGKPAEWAAQQKWKRRGKAAKNYGTASVVVVAILAVAGLAMFLDEVDPVLRIGAVLLVAVAGGAFAYMKFAAGKEAWTRSEHARIGVDSERRVRKIVRKSSPVAAVYGAKLGPRQGDCDLVLVDNTLALAAVEIKTGNGKVTVTGNTVRAGRKSMPRDPLGQCRTAAERVQKALKVTTLPVLCVPGMTNKPFFSDSGVLICSARHLVPALGHFGSPSFATPEEAEGACTNLWRKHLQYT